MRKSADEIKNRKEQILLLLAESFNESLTVQELADSFNVSKMTIRRDLDDLENLSLLERFHGGAKLNSKENNKEKRTPKLYSDKIKNSISQKAAEFVKNGSTIFINSSSTALDSLDYLFDKKITIVSNNLAITEKEINPSSHVIIPGGEIRFPRKILVGDYTLNILSKIRSDMTIIGCSGLKASSGVSTNNFQETRINELMVNNTNGPIILVAESSKIGKETNFIVTDLTNIDILITDIYANLQLIEEIEDLGVRVIQTSLDSFAI